MKEQEELNWKAIGERAFSTLWQASGAVLTTDAVTGTTTITFNWLYIAPLVATALSVLKNLYVQWRRIRKTKKAFDTISVTDLSELATTPEQLALVEKIKARGK